MDKLDKLKYNKKYYCLNKDRIIEPGGHKELYHRLKKFKYPPHVYNPRTKGGDKR